MSSPFCPSSRVTMRDQRHVVALRQPGAGLQRPLVLEPAVQRGGVERGGQVAVGRRVPHLVIEPVEDAVYVEMPVAQQAVQAAAALAAS